MKWIILVSLLLVGCNDETNKLKIAKQRLDVIQKGEEVIKKKVEEKQVQYDRAMNSGNREVACKLGREMLYWAAQVHNADYVAKIYKLQLKAGCKGTS